ncbi:THO complex subunit 6 homolog isoform X1 [Hippocampus zosterae]|uniref:THO complex subunit 6 homolog isoform X1 n=1 Tax=Hippocampus zosterae TaxID=109293 RepID=UPI00223DC06B|nr:THO complex subunit 6 homolog isoform X1 [Hippocampus zosterae]
MGPVELLHMSVFSQSFSPCGRFLAAGNNYGEIAIFSLCAALSPDTSEAGRKPVLTFSAHDGPVFCLESFGGHLLSAGDGSVSAWNWADLIKKNVKALWTRRPEYKASMEIPEINAMVINPRDNSVVFGGGDNNVHILDLEHGVFKSVFRGHSDYVHCLSVREREGEVLSGSEDGAVRMWDTRTSQCVHCVEVHKYQLLVFPCLSEMCPPPVWQVDQLFDHRLRLDAVRRRPVTFPVAPSLPDADVRLRFERLPETSHILSGHDSGSGPRSHRVPLPAGGTGQGSDPVHAQQHQQPGAQHQQHRAPGVDGGRKQPVPGRVHQRVLQSLFTMLLMHTSKFFYFVFLMA